MNQTRIKVATGFALRIGSGFAVVAVLATRGAEMGAAAGMLVSLWVAGVMVEAHDYLMALVRKDHLRVPRPPRYGDPIMLDPDASAQLRALDAEHAAINASIQGLADRMTTVIQRRQQWWDVVCLRHKLDPQMDWTALPTADGQYVVRQEIPGDKP